MIWCMVFWPLCLTRQTCFHSAVRCVCVCVCTYMFSTLHCDEGLVIAAVDQQQRTADFSPLAENILQSKLL